MLFYQSIIVNLPNYQTVGVFAKAELGKNPDALF